MCWTIILMAMELLADFLIRSNMCVLNGRSTTCTNDDYTCVSTRGSSEVDYCIILQDSASQPWNFRVTHDQVMESCIPDHSLLKWILNIDSIGSVK